MTTVIGPYEIQRVLGRGGMGSVYDAVHAQTGAPAALKTVSMPDVGQLESIRREIHALARIRHPGIVRILGEGVHDGLPWYAMERVTGVDLRHHALDPQGASEATTKAGADDPAELATAVFDRAPDAGEVRRPARPSLAPAIPWSAALVMIRRLCAPLAFLHGEGLVHRDLKPENVIVRPDGAPVIVDFGLVSFVPGETGREELEVAGTIAGTLAYMAPEQARGELVDARADIYALGAMAYELVTGRPPFIAESPAAFLWQHLNATPEPPSRWRPELPAEVDALILKMLAKGTRDRFGYAADVARAIARLAPRSDPEEPPEPSCRTYLYRPGFAGRVEAVEALEGHLARLLDGHGAMVMVGGESGVGKTRLCMEVARRAAVAHVDVLTGQCEEGGGPLHPFGRILQRLHDRCRTEGSAETDRLLGPRGKLLAMVEPLLGSLPGQDAYPDPAELSADAGRLRLLRAIGDTLLAMASPRPLLLLLEDAHWMDDLSLELLWLLGQSGHLPHHRLLLIATHRDDEPGERHSRLARMPHAATLSLRRLEEAGVGAMVADMLALPSSPTALVRFLARHAKGNPFVVAEYLRTAIAQGVLHRSSGRWEVAGDDEPTEATYEALALPRSVRKLVARRVAGLPGPSRRMLEVAAVLGREMPLELLRHAAGAGGTDALEALQELIARQFLEEGGAGIRFVHARVRDAVSEGVAPDARPRLHRAAAEAMETLFAGSLEARLGALGDHWQQAGESARARDAYLGAARHAVSRYAHGEAAQMYRASLALTSTPTPQSVAARNELGSRVLHPTGRSAEAQEEHRRALEEARLIGHRTGEAVSLAALGDGDMTAGRMDDARAHYGQAQELFEVQGERLLLGRLFHRMARLDFIQGRMEEAQQREERALEAARAAGDRSFEARVLAGIAGIHGNFGRLDRSRALLHEARALAAAAGDRCGEAADLDQLGVLEAKRGRLDDAAAFHQEALGIQIAIGDRSAEAYSRLNLARLHQERGRADEARPLIEQALRIQQETGNRAGEAHALMTLARLLTIEGMAGEARAACEAAHGIYEEIGNTRGVAHALGNLATLHFSAGRLEETFATIERAIVLHRELGDPGAEAHGIVNLACLLRLTGDLEAAAEATARALPLLMAIDDRVWIAKCLCEQAHLRLADGREAGELIAHIEELVGEVGLGPGSQSARSLEHLTHAAQALASGASLVFGHAREDLPPEIARWLSARGLLPD